jgi:PPM family protein phosphatase
MELTLDTASLTDVGQRRSDNEDSHALISRARGSAGTATLLVVADGMGGSNAGEVASRLTVDTVVDMFFGPSEPDPVVALYRAVERANRAVWQMSQSDLALQGMGTTCTALALVADGACFAHVGDSRAYLVRGRRAHQLTRDHSLVAQLVAQHHVTAEAARSDPRRNIVTRSVGIDAEVEIDTGRLEGPLLAGDALLVCSDGLHGQVTEEEIVGAVAAASPEAACRALVGLANARGGPDNITVLIARLAPPAPAGGEPNRAGAADVRRATGATAPADRRHGTLAMLVAVLAALVLALAAVAWIIGQFVLGRR